MKTVLVAGGYGMIGSGFARMLRKAKPDIAIVLAGRNPHVADALAEELGNAETVYLNLESGELPAIAQTADLIVSTVQDPADRLIEAAIAHGVAHIGITKLADDIAQTVFRAAQNEAIKPIVLLGHWQAGILTLLAREAAQDFSSTEIAHLGAVYDPLDPIGAMTRTEHDQPAGRALIRDGGTWRWMESERNPRQIMDRHGVVAFGHPMPTLDVPSIAALTSAETVRFDVAIGESRGTLSGGAASHDLYVELRGISKRNEPMQSFWTASDPMGQGHMTALGLLLAAEALIDNDTLSGGIHLPETLIPLGSIFPKLEAFGISIEKFPGDRPD